MPTHARHNDLALKIVIRCLSDLRPLGRRSKRHPKKQIERLAEGIGHFGFLNPILIDEEGHILAGVARVEAAKMLGIDSVPTITINHLTADEKRVYVLSENRLTELGEWDRAVLREELGELALIDLGFSLDISGFDSLEMEALVFLQDDQSDEPGFTTSITATTRLDDQWALDLHRLLCADAAKAFSYDMLLGGEKVRAIWVDPPFNVPIQGHVTSTDHREFVAASGEMSDAQFTEFLTAACVQFSRVLLEGGLAHVCMDWRHIKHLLVAAETTPLRLLNLAVWNKVSAGQGSFLRSQHELIPIFVNGDAKYQNNVQLGRSGRNRSNVWDYAHSSRHMRAEREDVPTPKPVNLVRDALLDCTSKGDLILDAFAGGGSAVIAAERIGRRARLLELDPLYCDVIVRRWEAATGHQATLLSTGETFHDVTHRRARERLVVADPAILTAPRARVRHRTTSAL